MVDYKRWFWLGFVSGIILPFMTAFIAKIIPSITITFSALPSATVSPALPDKIGQFFVQLTSPVGATLPSYIIAGIGGGLLAMLGALLISLPLTPNPRTAYWKVFSVLFWASLALSIFAMVGSAEAFIPVLTITALSSLVTSGLIVLASKILPQFVKIPN